MDWQWRVDGRAVKLDIARLQVWSTGWPEHSVHFEAEVALLHRWLLLERGIELHSGHELHVSLRLGHRAINFGHELILQGMNHSFLKLVTQLAHEQPFEDGSGANVEVAVHDEAHVLPRNVEFEVRHPEGKYGPSIF